MIIALRKVAGIDLIHDELPADLLPFMDCAAAAPAFAILHVVVFIPAGTAYGAHAAVPDMPFVIGEFALAAAPTDAAVPVVLFVPAGTATGADTAIPIVQVQFAAVQAVAGIGKIVSLMTLILAHQPPRRDSLDDTHHSNNKIAGKEKSHSHTYDETNPGNTLYGGINNSPANANATIPRPGPT